MGVLIAAIILLAAQLSDCLPGLGTGGGTAPSSAEQDTAAKEAPTKDVTPAPTEGEVSIAVIGSQCRIPGAASQPCEETCRRLADASDPARPIEIDATQGSHGTVEQLRTCLAEAGFTAVQVRSQ